MPRKNVPLAEHFNASKEHVGEEDGRGALHAGIKQEAARLVRGGQSIAAAAKSLGVVDQTLFHWVHAEHQGKLKEVDTKIVSAEQMEISRVRAALARVKMERDLLGKAMTEPVRNFVCEA